MGARISSMFTHGYSGYQNYGCRCDECRAGNVKYQRAARARRTARPLPPDRQHGIYTTYSNYGCRCEACKQANTDRNRALRNRNRSDV